MIETTARLNRGKVFVVEREPRVVVRFIYWTKWVSLEADRYNGHAHLRAGVIGVNGQTTPVMS